MYRYLTGSIDFLLTSFKTILGRFIFSIITKVDHIPFLAKVSCYLTFIKHALKHPQTRTHLCREPCRQTDRQTHTVMPRTMQPDRQTDTHTHAHTHLCREPYRQTHTITDIQTHTNAENNAARQPDRQTYTRTSEGTAVVRSIFSWKA